MAKTQATAEWNDGYRFTVGIRGHKVISDLPQDKGGGDAGPTPPEFLLAALATCTGVFARMFADREGLPAQGIEATATADTLASPMRLGNFVVRLRFSGLPREKHDRARAFIESCMVGQTLQMENTVQLKFE